MLGQTPAEHESQGTNACINGELPTVMSSTSAPPFRVLCVNVHYGLQVCESCVEHCGPAFHEQLAVGPFFKRIRQAVMEPDNPRVRASSPYHLQYGASPEGPKAWDLAMHMHASL